MYSLFPLALTLICTLGVTMSTNSKPANEDNAQHLQALLSNAAASLGGAERLRAVRSFSMTGTFRRAYPDEVRSGAYEIYFMSPDKLKKVEKSEVSKGVQLTLTQTLNRNDGWNDTDIATSGIELNVGKNGSDAQPLSANARKQMRADFARHLIAWFIAEPALNSMAFSYDGKGSATSTGALVLNLKGADDFSAQLTLDPKTHLPLMMTYRGKPPAIFITKSDTTVRPEQYETEIQVSFSDYRAENGIVLPHTIKVESGGKFLEEFNLKTCSLNPVEVSSSDFARN